MKYWLITYSQSERGRDLSATDIYHGVCPGGFLVEMVEQFPDVTTKIWLVQEITEETHSRLEGKVG